MNERLEAFARAYMSDEGKEILKKGKEIKEIDKKNDKKLTLISLFTLVSLTVLGYIPFGVTGAIIFFAIAYISNFALKFSSKKNILLNYITYYRNFIPKLIAKAGQDEVIIKECPERDFVSSLYPDIKLTYRTSHKYNDFYIAYAKFLPTSEGLLFVTDASVNEDNEAITYFKERLSEEFSVYTLKIENGKALLYLEGISDYLSGRVEMKDDLNLNALIRQFDYYLLAENFKKAVNGEKYEFDAIFHEIEENEFYSSI